MNNTFVKIGSIEPDIINKINNYRDHFNQIPNDSNLDIVIDIEWFRNHIDTNSHYPGISSDNAIKKAKRIIKNHNMIYYGSKKNGVIYIEMNSVNHEVIVLKYNKEFNNFKGKTMYPFSNQKLVSLARSNNTHLIK